MDTSHGVLPDFGLGLLITYILLIQANYCYSHGIANRALSGGEDAEAA